jgi:hypothetical protein
LGKKILVTVGEGDFVIHVFLGGVSSGLRHIVGLLLLAGLHRAKLGHLHVRAHVHVAALH